MFTRRGRFVLADHQQLFRQSMAACLVSGGHDIIGEADDGDTLDREMVDRVPDIVLLDWYLPKLDSLEYTRMLNAIEPQTQVLLLVSYEHEARALQSQAFLAGAAGCLAKDFTPAYYLTAVRRVLEGQILFTPDVMRRAARPTLASGPATQLKQLTEREREIIPLMAEGLGNREIADRLLISYNTTMKHASNIIRKLSVSNRMEAGLLYLRHGMPED